MLTARRDMPQTALPTVHYVQYLKPSPVMSYLFDCARFYGILHLRMSYQKLPNLLTIAAATFLLHSVASASTIVVDNTGVDSLGNLVAAGAAASFWTLTAEPAGATETIGSDAFRYHNPAYFADTATAAWVAPTASGNAGAGGDYTYSLTIDLTGLNPLTASISGIFGTDNDGSIFLNGNAPVATTAFAGFGSTTNFTINSGFVAGLNTIHVTMDNGGDPTAFFVQFSSATAAPLSAVPEPGAIVLTLAGLAGLALRLRSQRSVN
jgi:hypothetical protein